MTHVNAAPPRLQKHRLPFCSRGSERDSNSNVLDELVFLRRTADAPPRYLLERGQNMWWIFQQEESENRMRQCVRMSLSYLRL